MKKTDLSTSETQENFNIWDDPVYAAIDSFTKTKEPADPRVFMQLMAPIINSRRYMTVGLHAFIWVLNMLKLCMHIVVHHQKNYEFKSAVLVLSAVAAIIHPIAIFYLFKVSRLNCEKSKIYLTDTAYLGDYLHKTKSQGLKTIGITCLSLLCAVYIDEATVADAAIQLPTEQLFAVISLASVWLNQSTKWQSLILILTLIACQVLVFRSKILETGSEFEAALQKYSLSFATVVMGILCLYLASLRASKFLLHFACQYCLEKSKVQEGTRAALTADASVGRSSSEPFENTLQEQQEKLK